ncbi:MAG: FtsX-like permease family protein [Kofleriaceae bacterium]
MLTFRLAWRSFLRHRRRSAITSLALALGLAMMLVVVGIANGAHARMVELGVRMGAGHVIIDGKGYREERDLEHVIKQPRDVLAAARKISKVRAAVPRVNASGLLSAGDSSVAVVFTGVDPSIEPSVSEAASNARRVAGEYLRSHDQMEFANQPSDIYIGAQLAKNLNLGLGDRVVLTASPRGGGNPASIAFLVRGVFQTGLAELDGFSVQIPIEDAQKLLDLGSSITEIALMLEHADDVGAVVSAMRAAIPERTELEVLPWQEALAELHETIVLDDAGTYLMMAVVFVIVGIGIFNTVLMSVVERTRELGVMMAIGTATGRLFRLVMAEAAILAVIGCAVGLGIGLSFHSYLSTTGLDIQEMFGNKMSVAGLMLEGRMYSRLMGSSVAAWTVIIACIVLLSALYPAFRVSRLKPIEAMRHV